MLDLIIFDIDGTLVDSVDLHAEAWRKTLLHYGCDHPIERVRGQIGKGGDQLMPALMPGDLVERHGEEVLRYRSELFSRDYLPRVRPFAHVRDLFERIRSDGKKIALATSAKGDELEAYKRIADIEGLTEADTSSDDAEKSKPYPDIFQATMARFGEVAHADAVVIGDTPYDAKAASGAGLRTIGMLCGGFPEDGLLAAGCFAIYRDPADLLSRYDASPLGARRGP